MALVADAPDSPEQMHELFLACAARVRERGKDSVPISTLALSFGLVWHAFSEQESAEFFDDLASWYGGTSETGAVRVPTKPPRRERRFRSWFS